MRLSRFFIGFGVALLGLLGPEMASADIFSSVIGTIGAPIGSVATLSTSVCSGAYCGFTNLSIEIVNEMRPVVVSLALLFIIIAGFRMIVGQEDEIAGKIKTTITTCVSGIILMYLYEPLIRAFYGTSSWGSFGAPGAQIVSNEVAGLINWSLTFLGALAVAILIVTGIRAVAASGNEDGVANIRRSLFSIGAGILLITMRIGLNQILGLRPPDQGAALPSSPNASSAIALMIRLVDFLLSFLALAAVAIVIFAAIQMVTAFGRDDQIQKSKSLLTRAGIGLLVILTSLALVRFVMAAV